MTNAAPPRRRKPRATQDKPVELVEAEDSTVVPYDEDLLERARTQWQFGDWESLAQLDRETLQHHPDRAKLALLAAAGRLQLGQADEARAYVRYAQDWGVGKRLVSQILISGVYMSLGRTATLRNDETCAYQHFKKAIRIATPGADVRLLAPALARFQLEQLPTFGSLNTANDCDTEHDSMHKQVERLVQGCLSSDDVHSAVDAMLKNVAIHADVLCLFMLGLAESFAAKQDKVTATHFLRNAICHFDTLTAKMQAKFLALLVKVDRADTAADITVGRAIRGLSPVKVDDVTAKAIQKCYEDVRSAHDKKSEHGHDLLLDWLSKNISKLSTIDAKRVVIEIGTTREDVPGQGATAKIAHFCAESGLDFITVDMDPHNTSMAKLFFDRNNMPFSAVTQTGEEFLKNYSGRMDFVFLDAYDFDHGKHSELRQSRYERFLGHRINEQKCHQMHLDCAESVSKKLQPDGVVCIDDTWRDEKNQWTAKGTLAVPYLLNAGYRLIEARNRAALLKPPA